FIEALVPGRPPELDQRMLDAMYPVVRENYVKNYERMKASPGAGITEKAFKKALAYEYAFVKAGGLLGAGVDNTGNGGALAGLGDQRSFEILQGAGFAPVEAIKIRRLNGAQIRGAGAEDGGHTEGDHAE